MSIAFLHSTVASLRLRGFVAHVVFAILIFCPVISAQDAGCPPGFLYSPAANLCYGISSTTVVGDNFAAATAACSATASGSSVAQFDLDKYAAAVFTGMCGGTTAAAFWIAATRTSTSDCGITTLSFGGTTVSTSATYWGGGCTSGSCGPCISTGTKGTLCDALCTTQMPVCCQAVNVLPTPTVTSTRSSTSSQTISPSVTASQTPSKSGPVTPTSTKSLSQTRTPTPSVTASTTSTKTLTASRTATPSHTTSPSNTASKTVTPSVTASQTVSPTWTPSNTASKTQTPSSTPSRTETKTGTPSSTSSKTSTQTPSNTRTQTPTMTQTPSNSRTQTPSRTPTQTPSKTPSNTASVTMTPSNTASETVTPSNTASNSRTPTQTPSQTASNTITPTNTATQTKTRTPSRTPTVTPSNTASNTRSPTQTRTPTQTATTSRTPAVTSSTTRTPSKTPTGSQTASKTVTPSKTASQTISRTGTATWSMTKTPSTTLTLTASTTLSATPTPSTTTTLTESSTSSPSATASTTASITASSTPSFTSTATTTPFPIRITTVIQDISQITVFSPEAYIPIIIQGQGFRFTEPATTVLLYGAALRNISRQSNTLITAQILLSQAMWLNQDLYLGILDPGHVSTSIIAKAKKPAVQVPLNLMAISKTVVSYGDRITFTAPLVAALPISSVSLKAVSSPHVLVPCFQLRFTGVDSLSCAFLRVPERAFGRAVLLTISYENSTLAVEFPAFPLTLIRPALAPIPVLPQYPALSSGSMFATWNLSHTLQLGSLSVSGARAGSIRTAAIVEHGNFVSSFGRLDPGLGVPLIKQISNPKSLSARGQSMIAVDPIRLLRISPSRLQVPTKDWTGKLTLTIYGTRFIWTAGARLTNMTIGDIACGSVVAASVNTAYCINWTVPWDLQPQGHVTPLVVRAFWGSAGVSEGISLQMYSRPHIALVVPRLVQPGDALALQGDNFLMLNCLHCPSEATLRVLVGNTVCDDLVIISDNAAVCKVPNVLDNRPDTYPLVYLQVFDSKGQSHVTNASVNFVAAVQMQWQPEPSIQVSFVFPSGAAETHLFPIIPAPVAGLTGSGPVRCWVDHTSENMGGRLVGASRNFDAEVGSVQGADTNVVLNRLGIQSKSNVSYSLVGYCVDPTGSRGTISTIDDTNAGYPFRYWQIQTISWVGRWYSDAIDSLRNPLPPVSLKRSRGYILLQGITSAMNNTAMLQRIRSLFSCTLTALKMELLVVDAISVAAAQDAALAKSEGTLEPSPLAADGAAMWGVQFGELQLGSAALGGRYHLYAICEWIPTGETIAFPSLALEIVTLRIAFSASQDANNSLNAFRKQVYQTSLSLEHNVVPSEAVNMTARCGLRSRASVGVALTAASASQECSIALADSFTDALSIQIQGEPHGAVEVFAECVIWDFKIKSPTINVLPRRIELSAFTALPTFLFLSDLQKPVPMHPIVATVMDNLGIPAENISCKLIAQDSTVRLRLLRGDADRILPVNGLLNITDALVSPQDSTKAGNSKLAVMLYCFRSLGDDPVPIEWEMDIISLNFALLSTPSRLADQQGKLSEWSLRVYPALHSNISADAWGLIGETVADLGDTVTCTVSLYRAYVKAGDSTFAYVQRGTQSLGANQTMLFENVAILGRRGAVYTLVLDCGIGSLGFGQPLYFNVTLASCPAGTEPAGLVCEPCPEQTYTLGRNEDQCIGCPPIGVSCSGGTIRLLPNFFRPASESGKIITPESEFHTCYNLESCIVNETSFMYSCAQGYTGPLCGVCDVQNEYASFGTVCGKCWPEAVNKFLIGIVVVVFVAAVAFIGLRSNSDTSSNAAIVARITLGYLQALNSLQVLKAGGTPVFRSMMGWTQTMSESPFSSGPVQCYLRWPFLIRYISTISIPVAAAGTVLAVVAVVTFFRAITKRPRLHWSKVLFDHKMGAWLEQRRHISAMVFFTVLSYMPIVGISFKAIGCYNRTIAGTYYVLADLSVQCNSYQHIIVRLMSIVVLATFGLGLPIALFHLLRRMTPKRLAEDNLAKAFSFLYNGYKTGSNPVGKNVKEREGQRSLVWWESIVMFRKAVIASLAVVVTNPYYQVVGSIIVLAVFVFLQQQFQPYTNKIFNNLEILVLSVLFFTAAVSGILLRTLDAEGKPADVNGAMTRFVTVILIMINLVTMLLLLCALALFTSKRASQLKFVRAIKKRLPGQASASASDLLKGSPALEEKLSTLSPFHSVGRLPTQPAGSTRSSFTSSSSVFLTDLNEEKRGRAIPALVGTSPDLVTMPNPMREKNDGNTAAYGASSGHPPPLSAPLALLLNLQPPTLRQNRFIPGKGAGGVSGRSIRAVRQQGNAPHRKINTESLDDSDLEDDHGADPTQGASDTDASTDGSMATTFTSGRQPSLPPPPPCHGGSVPTSSAFPLVNHQGGLVTTLLPPPPIIMRGQMNMLPPLPVAPAGKVLPPPPSSLLNGGSALSLLPPPPAALACSPLASLPAPITPGTYVSLPPPPGYAPTAAVHILPPNVTAPKLLLPPPIGAPNSAVPILNTNSSTTTALLPPPPIGKLDKPPSILHLGSLGLVRDPSGAQSQQNQPTLAAAPRLLPPPPQFFQPPPGQHIGLPPPPSGNAQLLPGMSGIALLPPPPANSGPALQGPREFSLSPTVLSPRTSPATIDVGSPTRASARGGSGIAALSPELLSVLQQQQSRAPRSSAQRK